MLGRNLIFALLLLLVAIPAAQAGEGDLEVLLDGVTEIPAPGVPGPLAVLGRDAFPVVTGGKIAEPVVAAARYGRGRVVVFGHTGYLRGKARASRIFANAVRWAAKKPEDVMVLGTHAMDDAKIEEILAHLRRGGGLVTAGLGWGWLQLNPGKRITDHPGNRLLARMGILFADGTLSRTSRNGYALDRKALPLAHAGRALDLLVEAATSKRPPAKALLAQAGAVVLRAARILPERDGFLAPRLRGLRRRRSSPTSTRSRTSPCGREAPSSP